MPLENRKRAPIRQRLEALWNHERFGVPTVEDGTLFWGGSSVSNPFGHAVAEAEAEEEDLLVHTIDSQSLKRARMQTGRYGNLQLLCKLDNFGAST